MSKILPLVDYLNTFPPDSEARPQQKIALEKIAQIFSSGKKFALACLPTGSGKSHIAAAVARSATPIDSHRKSLVDSYSIYKKDREGNYQYEDDFLEAESFGSYILTVSKSLQDQYKELFPDIVLAKGKSNYACDIDPNVSVDFAPCLHTNKIKEKCFAANRCPYYKARNEAIVSLESILNYRSFIALPSFLRKREIYICDEAGDLENELVAHYSITIQYSQLQSENIDFKKLLTDDSVQAGRWLNDVYLKLNKELESTKDRLSAIAKKETHEVIKTKEMQRLGKLTGLVNSLSDVISYWDECEYLVEVRDAEKVTFVPYDIKPLAKKIFDGADMVLMMSATITDHEEFTKSLGISKPQYEYVEIGSSFDPKKSPIKYSKAISLSHKTMDRDLPKVLDMVVQICNSHKGEKGIIHTHTNKITEALKRKIGNDDRFLFRQLGVTNEDILEEHKNRKDDTILISPSLDTGISLDGDLGRFQIIIKAPFLPLGSKRIKKIFDKNPKYYIMKMLDTFVQMCGRCTRSVEDHSTTYVLDGVIFKNIVDNHNKLPKHFIERFI